MVNYSASSATLDATFAALADPTRRAILAHLSRSPDATVGEIARPFAMSLPAVSKHLRVLEDAGLLSRRREGREHHCRVVAAPLKPASAWIARYEKFWEGRLEALARYLEESADEEPRAAPGPRHRRRNR
jgi:DNA-binding transcriptional ArsR family regulator